MKPLGRFDIAMSTLTFALSVSYLISGPVSWIRVVAAASIAFWIAVLVMEIKIRKEVKRARDVRIVDAILEIMAIDRILRDNGVRHSLDDVIAEYGLEDGK